MKHSIFMPIVLLCSMLAFLTISCEKNETDLSDVNYDVGEKQDTFKFEEINRTYVTHENLTMEQGKHYDYDQIKELAPELYKTMDLDNHRKQKNSRTVTSRWVIISATDDCLCDEEYCPDLGAVMQGQKSTGWVQIGSANSGNPYASMVYAYDPKPLYNYSAGLYHHIRHINYNSNSEIAVQFLIDDSNNGLTSVDIDVVTVPAYGVYTYFDVASEYFGLPPWFYTENAVVYDYSTCASCSDCP